MSDDKQVNIMEGHAQVGAENTQIINPTTNNNTTTNNTTNNNTTDSRVNIHFQQNNNYNIYLSNAPEPVAQHNTTSQLLSREQLLQLQQICQTGPVTEHTVQQITDVMARQQPTEHAIQQVIDIMAGQQPTEHTVQQVTDVMARQQPTEQPSPSCDECRIRTRPQCLTCVSRTIPGQSAAPPSQSVGESPQTCRPESPQSRCPLSDHHQPSRKSGRDTDRKQKSSRKNKETDRQPPNQTPGCSESDQMSRVPAEETEPTIQPASTETAECVRLVDCKGRQLQPGDAVWVEPDGCSSLYCGIYIGGRELIHCDEKTQEVKMEMMDTSNTIYRFTPSSYGPCKIFPAETRIHRARSCIGKVSPVEETTWGGLDFVCWTFTGLDWDQAVDEGFDLL